MRKSIPCLSLFCLLTICLPAKAEGPKPIVAVFQIEAKRITLDAELLEALTDILSAKLTATGGFGVVPKNEIKKRLLTAKQDSYKECFDQKCQIELGRELAADKTLHSQITKIGSSCNVSVTLHDLKKASSEAAATASGGCTEDEISKSLDQVVAELAGKGKATQKTLSPPLFISSATNKASGTTGPPCLCWASPSAGRHLSKRLKLAIKVQSGIGSAPWVSAPN